MGHVADRAAADRWRTTRAACLWTQCRFRPVQAEGLQFFLANLSRRRAILASSRQRNQPEATSAGPAADWITVDLYEYQARDLFEKYGVPVLPGIVADTPEEVRAAAEKLGGVTVVKAQVKVGGRGKAGGVKVAKNPDEAEDAAK